FDPGCRSAGYVAWCDVRVGGCYGDPLFSYYSYHYRSDPGWSVSISAGYVGCYNGTIAPPPRTLVQQNTVVQNITNINKTVINNGTINNTNVRNTTMLTSLNQMGSKGVQLKQVPQQERLAARASAQELVKVSHQRVEQEKQILAQGPPPTKSTDKPHVAKV